MNALLFMPDISGFTKFVNETEITHSQHIVQELLEILIDSNQMKLQVNEIEGDAILFFRPGEKPSLTELLKQVEAMYFKFHQHLKLYDHQRICPCGACKSAIDLKLKVIVHFGEVAQYSVKDHKKLFGKDVIVVHRLLKNNVDSDEYILMTHAVVNDKQDLNKPSWFSPAEGSGIYDAVEIQYAYAVLSGLSDKVPEPEIPHLRFFESAKISFTDEEIVDANMNEIFAAIFDLDKRADWMEGVKGIKYLGHDKINRKGTVHRCLTGTKNQPVIITESASLGKDKMELVEMNKNGMGGCRFKLQVQSPGVTKVIAEVLVRKNPIVQLMFGLLMKKSFKKAIRKSLENLKLVCSGRVQTSPGLQ